MPEFHTDADDALPLMEAQPWAREKHEELRRYLDISHSVRRKLLALGAGATYVELFCGPGRLMLKDDQDFTAFDGSPLVAFRESLRTNTAFTTMHLGDEEPAFCNAVQKRLQKLGAKVQTYPMRASTAAARIATSLNGNDLNVAFLDPFNLGALPFPIIQAFAPLKRMDMLVHVSAMDLMRQLPSALAGAPTSLDNFAPGWRSACSGLEDAGEAAQREARGKYIDHWLGLCRLAGFKAAKVWKLIRGQSNQPLYWLVLLAKHDLATKFWDEVSKPKQGDMFG